MTPGDLGPAELVLLRRAVGLAQAARDRGDHPFGALLVTADGTEVEAMNSVVTDRDATGHAETNLVRAGSRRLDLAVLGGSTLFTSTEPCAMCAGAIYWSGIGRVVYALAESDLRTMAGEQAGVPTLDLPCREVLAHGGRPVVVVGPVSLPEATEVHAGFWV